MIMQVTRVAPITLSQNDSQLSIRWYQAMASEPITPQAAHSVAVAQPNNSAAKTSRMSSMVGMSCADSRTFWRNVIGGSGGGRLFRFSSRQKAEYSEDNCITTN